MDATRRDVALLYRRAGFGASAAELDAATAAGYEATVEAFLAGLEGPDPGGDAVPEPVVSHAQPPAGPPGSQSARDQRHALAAQFAGLQAWWADRMVATSTPLREKLTLFWHGHFATGFSKVRDVAAMYDQNQLLRTAGGGSFEGLTAAVAEGEAMMVWLDTGTDKAAHPNENFAREMMELFTLGVGHYSQDDVVAAARGFSGWVTDRRTGAWHVQPHQHDGGRKTYLGHTGNWDGQDIIHLAVADPASPRFVVAELWSNFASPVGPADEVVSDLLAAYGPGSDIAATLRAIFLHPAFRSEQTRQGLVRQPIDYLVAARRALGPAGATDAPAGAVLVALATRMAQTLFDPPNVGGWGRNAYWLDTATSLARLDAAVELAARADLAALQALPAPDRPGALADVLGVDGWGPTTAAALNHTVAVPTALVATALTAPEFVLA